MRGLWRQIKPLALHLPARIGDGIGAGRTWAVMRAWTRPNLAPSRSRAGSASALRRMRGKRGSRGACAVMTALGQSGSPRRAARRVIRPRRRGCYGSPRRRRARHPVRRRATAHVISGISGAADRALRATPASAVAEHGRHRGSDRCAEGVGDGRLVQGPERRQIGIVARRHLARVADREAGMPLGLGVP
jgi:hypothetical protein